MGVSQKSSKGLGQLRNQLAGLSSSKLRLLMARNLAEEARSQVANGFRQQRDPYGKPWAPLKHRQGQILQDTGRLRASVATRATERGFQIDMPVVYAAVHQYGSTITGRRGGVVVRGGKAKAGTTRGSSVGVSFRRASKGVGKIPQRQMIPMQSTGGLGPIWTAAFDETARTLITKYVHGAAP